MGPNVVLLVHLLSLKDEVRALWCRVSLVRFVHWLWDEVIVVRWFSTVGVYLQRGAIGLLSQLASVFSCFIGQFDHGLVVDFGFLDCLGRKLGQNRGTLGLARLLCLLRVVRKSVLVLGYFGHLFGQLVSLQAKVVLAAFLLHPGLELVFFSLLNDSNVLTLRDIARIMLFTNLLFDIKHVLIASLWRPLSSPRVLGPHGLIPNSVPLSAFLLAFDLGDAEWADLRLVDLTLLRGVPLLQGACVLVPVGLDDDV